LGPAFTELDWSRFDVWAVVQCEGIVAIYDDSQREAVKWLAAQNYDVSTIDFSRGVSEAVSQLGNLLDWEGKFGPFNPSSRNLDALNDGFDFDLNPGQGHVLELKQAHLAYDEDPRWTLGLLSITRHYSRCQLALGVRFITLVGVNSNSNIIGATVDSIYLNHPTFEFPSL
jgi:hypothetical protein